MYDPVEVPGTDHRDQHDSCWGAKAPESRLWVAFLVGQLLFAYENSQTLLGIQVQGTWNY